MSKSLLNELLHYPGFNSPLILAISFSLSCLSCWYSWACCEYASSCSFFIVSMCRFISLRSASVSFWWLWNKYRLHSLRNTLILLMLPSITKSFFFPPWHRLHKKSNKKNVEHILNHWYLSF